MKHFSNDVLLVQPHSEVPVNDEDWPLLEEILSFRDRVRKRLMRLYDDFESGRKVLTRKAGRVIWMTFEHETMHAEVSYTSYRLVTSEFNLAPRLCCIC